MQMGWSRRPWRMAAAVFVSCALWGTAVGADRHLGRNLAAGCANCHGTNGRNAPGTLELNNLAGEPKEKILQKMEDYRSGIRPASIMHQIARGYTDAQLKAIAEWFASQPK